MTILNAALMRSSYQCSSLRFCGRREASPALGGKGRTGQTWGPQQVLCGEIEAERHPVPGHLPPCIPPGGLCIPGGAAAPPLPGTLSSLCGCGCITNVGKENTTFTTTQGVWLFPPLGGRGRLAGKPPRRFRGVCVLMPQEALAVQL